MAGLSSGSVISLDGEWWLATDPKSVGRTEGWWKSLAAEAKKTRVPSIIQSVFPGYHGVAWYWKQFAAPANPNRAGRYLLRFGQVDYLADVWLNGVHIGTHEGGETPFVLEATEAIKPKDTNLVTVRVLNPTHERIDGLVLDETPHRCKVMPYRAGAAYNHGGITESVELLLTPAVRIEDLFVSPDPRTGTLSLQVRVNNASPRATMGELVCSITPATQGEILDASVVARELPPGETLLEGRLRVDNVHLWTPADPYLYRVAAQLMTNFSDSIDQFSTRCGFRDFRFENGYFRLNGRRIFVRSSHTVNHYPIGLQFAHDPDLERRDLLNAKVMGFNMVRFIWGGAKRSQLDLCDEIGLLVYNETYASYPMTESPQLEQRFDRSVAEVIQRDRNHPSIVIWGLLNENKDGRQFRHAMKMLPLVRSLDRDRMVFLNSGRFDGQLQVGSISNPGSLLWECVLGDEHPQASPTTQTLIRGRGSDGDSWFGRSVEEAGDAHLYSRVPETAATTLALRRLGHRTNHVFLTEYGIGSAVDLWRTVRHFERFNALGLEDGQFYNDKLNRFLKDWKQWRLDECFARPADFFAASLAKMAGQRTLGLNAIRSNPNLVGYSLTGMIDHVMTGEGLTTPFRELKPGTIEALFEGWAPLRLCLFAEPLNAYCGALIKLEVVLANEDALEPGEYPIHLQVVGPNNQRVYAEKVSVKIPDSRGGAEPKFALPVFTHHLKIEGPGGKYRFIAEFERGAAATGGEATIYLADRAIMPRVEPKVLLWGKDSDLEKWLREHNIVVEPFASGVQESREVILVSKKPASGEAEEFRELCRHIARGSTVVFLSQEVFAKGTEPLGWLPLANKGKPAFLDKVFYEEPLASWLYLKDEWAKRHPIFDGLPAGGLMDYTFYREIIPDAVWVGQDPPAEAVAGAIKASQDYSSGLLVAVYMLGAGEFILNTLLIREQLGKHPAAGQLLSNMLRYAARQIAEPLIELPANFEDTLKTLGYV